MHSIMLFRLILITTPARTSHEIVTHKRACSEPSNRSLNHGCQSGWRCGDSSGSQDEPRRPQSIVDKSVWSNCIGRGSTHQQPTTDTLHGERQKTRIWHVRNRRREWAYVGAVDCLGMSMQHLQLCKQAILQASETHTHTHTHSVIVCADVGNF
jgi:hypothetical protein